MAEYIVMPKLGFDMREGVLVSWLKKEGDNVNKGDVVAEIESDKATLELESQASGTILKLLAQENDVVPVGANLAIVGEPGEDISGLDQSPAGEAPAEPEPEPAAAAPSPAAAPAPATEAPSAPAAAAEDGAYPGGVKASPVARRMAAENQVDLRLITGTGPGGRIRKRDVEAFLAQPAPAAAPVAAPVAAPTPVAVGPDSEEVPLTRLRQAIARRMTESKQTIPAFYVTTSIDMAPALAMRKEINATLEPRGIKVSVNDMIVKAVGLALRDFPNLNASFGGDKLIRHKHINVGSAVAVEGGLLTVVQRNTDNSTLSKIAQDHYAMITRAREGKVLPEDVTGSTFTVSNLGAFDVDHFIAIINPPEAAILAVGSAEQVPVVENGEIKIGTRMKATISADHRVTDGAEAARFLQRVKELLETPLQLLL